MRHDLLAGKKLRARATALPSWNPEEILSRLHPEEFPCLLESVAGPEDLCQHSYLAWDPWARLLCSQGRSTLHLRDGREIVLPDSPLDALRAVMSSFAIAEDSEKPFPFSGGAIGWLSYDLGRWIEKLPPSPLEELALPELALFFFDRVIGWQANRPQSAQCISWEGIPVPSPTLAPLQAIEAIAARPKTSAALRALSSLRADHDAHSYAAAVRRAKEWILEGDLYQINLSQRFEARIEGPSWLLYRRLKKSNPAPYAAYLASPWGELLSSSPEMFLRIRGREIETRPIKGTRPRTGEAKKDAMARQALLQSGKDRAELNMIVDLERNDLKRVCETGSVEVPRLYGLEEYETVFHLVSTIRGRLRPQVDLADVLRATFPGGSITGAPKIRAMERIAQSESAARSLYTGSIGWIGYDADAEWNIAIRTILRSGDRACYRVGGGIVADSDPAAEYAETLHKGRGLARALGMEGEIFA